MRGIGDLCLRAGDDGRYDARKPVRLLVAGAKKGAVLGLSPGKTGEAR